jgi:hypothetical protein
MVDRPLGDEVKTTYRGKIRLNAVPSEGPAAAVSTAASSTASRTTATTSGRSGC